MNIFKLQENSSNSAGLVPTLGTCENQQEIKFLFISIFFIVGYFFFLPFYRKYINSNKKVPTDTV